MDAVLLDLENTRTNSGAETMRARNMGKLENQTHLIMMLTGQHWKP
jgi:hypothetical protein